MPGRSTRDDGARSNVNRHQRVVPGRRGVDAVAVRRKVERIGKWPHGDPRGDLPCEVIGACIEDPHVAAGAADPEHFRATGMLAYSRESWPDCDACHGFELHEVHDGDVAVSSSDISAQMQVRAQKRRAMFAQKHNESGDGQGGKQKIRAEVLGTIHVRHEIVPCFDERSNAELKHKRCGAFSLMVSAERLWDFLLEYLRFWFWIGLGRYVAN